jgi:hypothetical protein
LLQALCPPQPPVVSIFVSSFGVLIPNVGVPLGLVHTRRPERAGFLEDEEGGGAMSTDVDKHRRRWTGPERLQVVLTAASLLVAVIALAVQFTQ